MIDPEEATFLSPVEQTVSPVAPGEIVAGRYRVERVLGQGGMGVVVAARHVDRAERVAIKFLLPDAAKHPEVVARFLREAHAVDRIQSEHVAKVKWVDTLPSGAPFMIMEYLDGRDLATTLEIRGRLPFEEAVDYVLQACEAIADAHAVGIIHRDLKPANLFLIRRTDGTPMVKVLDFGISKLTGRASSPGDGGLTRTSAMLGSPMYMSPEQVSSSRDVGPATDIWSLGVVLYELLLGTQPFTAESLGLLMVKILQEDPTPIRRAAPDVPQGLADVVDRCLQKSADKRFADVAELAAALAPFAPRRARHSVDRISRILHQAGVSASLTALPPSTDPLPLVALTKRSAGVASSTGGVTRAPISRDVDTPPEVPVSALPWRAGLVVAGVAGLALLGARLGGVLGGDRAMTGAPLAEAASGNPAPSAQAAVPASTPSTAPPLAAMPPVLSPAVAPSVAVAAPQPATVPARHRRPLAASATAAPPSPPAPVAPAATTTSKNSGDGNGRKD